MKDKFNIFTYKTDNNINSEVYIKNYLNNNIQYHYSIINIDELKKKSDNINNIIRDHLRSKKNNIIILAKKLKISSENIINDLNAIHKKVYYLEQIFKFQCSELNNLIFNIIISNPYIKEILRYEISCKKNINTFLLYCKNKLNEDQYEIINNQINDIFIDLKPDYDTLNDLSVIINKKYLDYYYLNTLLDYIINYKNIYKSFSSSDIFFNKISSYFLEFIENNELSDQKNFILFLDKYKYKIKYLNNISYILYLIFMTIFKINNVDYLIKLLNITNYLKKNGINQVTSAIFTHFKSFETEDVIINLSNIINTNIINNQDNEYLYELLCNSKYVELFLNINQLNLLKRYIYTDYNEDNEIKYYKQMKKYFTKKQIYKYNRTIKNLFTLSKYNANIFEEKIKYIDIGVNIWPLNTIEGYSKIEVQDHDTSDDIIHYNYLHIGRYEFELTTNNGCFNIISLPIHYYIITDIINKNFHENSYPFYKKEYIMKIINQLVGNRLINFHEWGDYSINNEYDNGDINLIDIEEIETIAINKIKKYIAHEEKHIIISNISSILKNNNYTYDEMFKIISDKTSSYIDFNHKKYDSSIKEMIEKDYITLENDMYYKYIL